MYKITPEKKEEIVNLCFKYKEFISPHVQEMIDDFAQGEDILNDIILELYTYTNAIDTEVNLHYGFYKNLKEKFPNLSSRKILEVASGYLPSLSLIISRLENMEHSITTIDPLTLPIKHPGINSITADFTIDTPTKDYDLIISSCPCEALDPILEQVIKNKKEMSVQTCQCGPGGVFYSRYEWYYYIDSIIDRLEPLKNYGFTITQEYGELSRMMDAPIITVRKLIKESHQ